MCPQNMQVSLMLCADWLVDPDYRKAFRLDPDDFGLTLNLAEMDILGRIKTHLAPNAELRAMHYKLNVYVSLALLVYPKCLTLWLSLCTCHAHSQRHWVANQ